MRWIIFVAVALSGCKTTSDIDTRPKVMAYYSPITLSSACGKPTAPDLPKLPIFFKIGC